MTKRDREELNYWNAMAVTALLAKYVPVWFLGVDYPGNSIWIIVTSMFILQRQFFLFSRGRE